MPSAPLLEIPPAPALQIAHVLFMDVVGYSSLPMDQQQNVLRELQEAVRATPDFSRAQASGELIRLPTGDGMALVFFAHPEAPVRCAVELSRALRGPSRIPLRMGIHFGSVYPVPDINATRNVAGAGINIAQRVMDCGDAGHILISEEVAKLLGQLTTWSGSLHDLGEVEVKHGVHIHIYNLYTSDAGNPSVPSKLVAARAFAAAATRKRRVTAGVIAAGLILALALGAWSYRQRRAHALTATDTVLLADFENNTSDPAFEDTLKQALSIKLKESPFLSLLSDNKVNETLAAMTRPADTRLTKSVAREVCERAGGKAYISGAITSVGSLYVISLDAVDCLDGDSLAQEFVQVPSKEKVIDALGVAASRLRGKLGESLSTVKSFDVPLSQATTPSLEALEAYSTARKIREETGDSAAIPLYKRAIELDPNFALAYDALGSIYIDLQESRQAGENFQKAYQLRNRGSERENLIIAAYYYSNVTGDLDKAIQAYNDWSVTYPRDSTPHLNLGLNYMYLGDYQKAVAETLQALHLNPSESLGYNNLMAAYAALNRLDDAKAVYQQASARNLVHPLTHATMYGIAFLEGDTTEMNRQVQWAAGNAEAEEQLLPVMASTEAYYGRLDKSLELAADAAESCWRKDEKEAAAALHLISALRAAEFGDLNRARRETATGLALASTRDVQVLAALALARSGDSGPAEKMASELARGYPMDMLINDYWLPTIRASIEIDRGNPARAVDFLRSAQRYELGQPPQGADPLYPVYVRAEAFRKARRGAEAAAEFQKILSHRGIMQNSPLGALARLGLARSLVLQGDPAKARAAYQNFLALWKDAGPGVPILAAAQSEYARLN